MPWGARRNGRRAHNLTDVELDDLRTFVVLAESRDLDLAARGLHASPATVRRSVARLEHDFGGPLIVAPGTGNGGDDSLVLTAMGEQVLDKALDVLEAAADLLHAIHRPEHRPYVIVGSLFRLLLDEIVEAVPMLDRLSGGDVSVELREASDDDPSGGLSRGRVDAAVLVGPTDLDGSLVRRPVGQVARVAMLARHHPLAGRSGVEVRELDADTWVEGVHVPDSSWPAFWRCEDVRGRAPARMSPVNGLAAQVEAIRLGAGVCVRPSPLAAHLGLEQVAVVPIVDAPPCPVDIAYRVDTPWGQLFDALAHRVAATLDARPVGVRIRASSVVAGAVVTGQRMVPRPGSMDENRVPLRVSGEVESPITVNARRTRLGLTGRLRSLTTGRAD